MEEADDESEQAMDSEEVKSRDSSTRHIRHIDSDSDEGNISDEANLSDESDSWIGQVKGLDHVMYHIKEWPPLDLLAE